MQWQTDFMAVGDSKALEADPEVETRQGFLDRRQREKAVRIKNETADERQRRLSRERDTKTCRPPRQNNHRTSVFVWERDGAHEVRTLLYHGEYDDVWERHMTTEMLYDSIHDEWDIWTDSPNFKFQPPMDDNDEGLPADDGLPSVPVGEPGEDIENNTILAPHVHADSFKRDVAACFSFDLGRTEGHFAYAYDTAAVFPLVERMQDWYGFHPTAKVNRWDLVKIPSKLDEDRVRHVLKDSISVVDKEQLPAMQQFVASLVQKVETPGALSDMHGKSISDFGNSNISVHRSLYKAKMFDHPNSPLLTLYSVDIVHEDGRIEEDRERRCFFVWDATTALAIKRLPRSRTRSLGHVAEFYFSVVSPMSSPSRLYVSLFPLTISVFPVLVLGLRTICRIRWISWRTSRDVESS